MYRRYIKRPLDIVFALALIIALAPVYLITAIVIKLESKGPVIFKQTRTGLNGKPFTLFKFRSMTAQNNVYDNTSTDEVTRVGAFIRKTSIDELPQLINVIMGDMSFIGPRPWIPEYHKHMSAKQRRRSDVRPGITGLAQSRGRNALTINEKIDFDLRYASHLSLYEDLKVIFFTVVTLYDKSTLHIGKSGIHDEIMELKKQQNNTFDERYSSMNKVINNSSLVSIVVPVYNAEKFIKDTVKTVIDQTYDNWELLLVDDCSTDKSVKIIKEYQQKDKRIKLFSNSKNSGAAISRNRGIEESRGRYIAFLDADDLWEPKKLEKQVAFMQEKGCAFSFTGYEFADENGTPNGKKVNVPERLTYRQALRNTIIWTTTVMFDMQKLSKKDVFMPNVKSEDTACWWKVLKKIDQAYGMTEILSYYRRSSGSLSSNKLEAVKRVWNLYRNVENLNLIYSAYCFAGYAYNTVKKRI